MATTTREIDLPYNFSAWPHQEDIFLAFYDHGIRRFCEVWHRRAGKDKCFLNLMIDQMTLRVGNYCHVFPERNRARRIVWQGIDSDGRRYTDHFPPPLVYRKREEEMMISLVHPDNTSKEGSIYWCLGSDKDTNLLVGTNPIGVIWSEYAEINPRMRELVLPILRRNNGWEAIVMTPRGRNHAYRLYNQVRGNPQWHVSYLTVDETHDGAGRPLVTEADVASDIADGMLPETAQQEYYLSWDTPMPGAYYAEEMRRIDASGRLGAVPYDANFPVYTSWDLGHNDTNAIWFFQLMGSQVRFIDYEEGSSVGLCPDPEDEGKASWIGTVRAKPYNYDHSRVTPPLTRHAYEVHYGPHDIEVTDYGPGKTRYSQALSAGLRFTVIPRGPIEDRIAAARRLLARAVFDEAHCATGLDALRSYRRQFDEQKQVFVNHPYHDWASNGADSFGYAAVGLMPALQPLPDPVSEGSWDYFDQQRKRSRRGLPARTFYLGGKH